MATFQQRMKQYKEMVADHTISEAAGQRLMEALLQAEEASLQQMARTIAASQNPMEEYYRQLIEEHAAPHKASYHAFLRVRMPLLQRLRIQNWEEDPSNEALTMYEEDLRKLFDQQAQRETLSFEQAFLGSILLGKSDLRVGAIKLLHMLLILNPTQSVPFHNWDVYSSMSPGDQQAFGPFIDTLPVALYPQTPTLDMSAHNRQMLHKLQNQPVYVGGGDSSLSETARLRKGHERHCVFFAPQTMKGFGTDAHRAPDGNYYGAGPTASTSGKERGDERGQPPPTHTAATQAKNGCQKNSAHLPP